MAQKSAAMDLRNMFMVDWTGIEPAFSGLSKGAALRQEVLPLNYQPNSKERLSATCSLLYTGTLHTTNAVLRSCHGFLVPSTLRSTSPLLGVVAALGRLQRKYCK